MGGLGWITGGGHGALGGQLGGLGLGVIKGPLLTGAGMDGLKDGGVACSGGAGAG